MRTRIYPKMLNSEVQEYLKRNDIIIIPVGTIEMHGGYPLDVETVTSEAIALKMAEACDGLVLTGLPYFYAGATASGRSTVQVSIREGMDYLGAIARNLLRIGFKRQIYISFHGPAHMTISPMVRDFYDETGVPILYMDMAMQMFTHASDIFMTESLSTDSSKKIMNNAQDVTKAKEFVKRANAIFIGAYEVMGRLEDIPLTTEYEHNKPQSCVQFNDLFNLAYQSGAIGYCFGENDDHGATVALPDESTRKEYADLGVEMIDELVKRFNMPHVVEQMQRLETYGKENEAKYPWMPSAWNNRR
ncbi:MAG: creatininase family protein [Erysipelotrichales bacterium]|nr:creatininase family protein [Erysipelotrichales bacterium]